MIKKTVFRGKILHKISIWTRENCVESPAEGFLPEVGKVYPQCPKGLKKHFYQNQIFLQICSYVNVDCPSDNPAEVLNFKKKLKPFVTGKILHKNPDGHQKTVLTAQPRNF